MADRVQQSQTSIGLKEFKQLIKEMEERNQYGAFKPVTLEEAKAQTNLLKELKKEFGDSGKKMYALYSSTEEKRRIEEQKKERQSLLTQGNFKSFIFQQTEGLRKTFHASMDIKGADLGKGVVKGLSAFGLFGKFDTSSLVRKFDEYKAFSSDRGEKVKNAQLIEQIRKWFLEDNKKQEDVERFLSSIGISTSKTADLFVEFNKQYKEQYEAIRNLGVLNDTGTKEIVKEMSKVRVAIQDEKQSALSNKEYTKFTQEGGTQEEWDIKEKEIAEKEKFEEINKKRNIGGLAPFAHPESAFQWEAQQIPKPSKKKNTSNIPDIDVDTTAIEKGSYSEDNLNELVRQGKVLDEMLVYSREQVILKSEEMRLTEEFRNREGEKKDKKDEKSNWSLSDILSGGFLAKTIGSAIAGWFGASGLALAIPAAIGLSIGGALMGIAKIASDWLDSKKTPEELAKSRQETSKLGASVTAGEFGMDILPEGGISDEQTTIMADNIRKERDKIKNKGKTKKQIDEEERRDKISISKIEAKPTPPIEAKPEKVSIPEEIKKYTTYSNPAQKRAMEDRARQVKEQRDSSIGTQNNTTVNNVKGDEKTFMRDIFSGDGLGATP